MNASPDVFNEKPGTRAGLFDSRSLQRLKYR